MKDEDERCEEIEENRKDDGEIDVWSDVERPENV
jgi:hypothetical protein